MFIKKTGDIYKFLNNFSDALFEKGVVEKSVLIDISKSMCDIFPSIPDEKIIYIFMARVC